MILVDSSVWIDFFSSAPGRAGDELRRMISDAEPFALTGVVVAEILQGRLTTIDALIAAIALEHRASVFTLDKDFSRIARLRGLQLHPLESQELTHG